MMMMKKINKKVELHQTNDGYVGAGTYTGQEEVNKRIEKLEIQVSRLRTLLEKYEPFLKLGDATASVEAQRQHVLGDPSSRLRLVEEETVNESNASWRSRTTTKEEDDNK